MRPYLDFSFLVRLIVLVGERSRIAGEIIQQFQPPFPVNHLHVLQVENFFQHTVHHDPRARSLMTSAAVRWRNRLSELVFETVDVDWRTTSRRAVVTNRLATNWPGTPLALLHLEAAQLASATHLLSFDSRQRALAVKAGLCVLPEVLS